MRIASRVLLCLVAIWTSAASAWTHSPASKEIGANGGSFTLTVSGTEYYDWSAGVSGADWISVTRVNAKTFTVTVAANNSKSVRVANVYINAYQGGSTHSANTWVNMQSCGVTQSGRMVVSSLTYENLRGATHDNPATYVEGSAFAFAAPSAIAGYIFTGWSPAAITAGMEGSKVITATWRPTPPTISPANGTILSSATSVNIATDNPDATIYCTTDGTEPTTSSPVYKLFKASSKMTVKAIAVVDGMAWSETTTAEYALGQCADPTITPTDGMVFGSSNYQVSIAKNGEKGVLRYTTDGSDPTEASPVYSGPFAISETTTVKAKVFDADYFDSAVVSATLTRQWTKVATPVIVAPENFSGTKLSVSLTCATDGAVIRYTTDGSEPNSHSPKYMKPFDITGTTVVKAIALKTDCTTSDVATMTISKQWCIGDALNDSDRQFTTDVGTGWVRDTSVSHDGSEAMKSGAIANSVTMGVYAMSTLSTVVDGKGTVRFWWKASCEEDDAYEWDHGELRVDGVTVARINGTAGWSEVVHEISSAGSHTISWIYCKDDFGKEGEDSIWVDQFAWQPNDPIPDLGDNPTPQQVAAALDGSADVRLAQNITDGAAYDRYRTWATKVKAKGGTDPVGAEAVVASTNAWLSFALDSETLIENAPSDGDVTIDSFEPTAVGGAFEFAVGVAGVYVGEGAEAENLAKIFGLVGGEKIGEMSADKVSVTFGEPTGGKVRLLAGPKDASLSTFFMRVRMTP